MHMPLTLSPAPRRFATRSLLALCGALTGFLATGAVLDARVALAARVAPVAPCETPFVPFTTR